ncbi:MAG: hypothetical protein ACE5K9_04395 [Candidatus Methylomirabilales bacterium]
MKKKRVRKGQRRKSRRALLIVVVGLTALVLVLILIGSRPQLPSVGDHWHARYEIIVCGERFPFLPYTQGEIHTHGDGQLHIHPKVETEAGANSNLGRFFANAGLYFDREMLRLPGGETVKNGDRCPDGRPGRLRLVVNGSENTSLDKYVPQEGDFIRIEFRQEAS